MNLRAQYTITEEQRIRLAAKPTRTAPNTFRKTAPSLLTHRSSGQFKRPGPSVGRVCPVPTQIHDPLVERFPLISSAPESVEASSCTTCQRQGQSALRETAAETIHIRHSLDATRVQGLYLPQACAREPRRMRLECLMLTARIHRRDKQQREKTTSVSPDGKRASFSFSFSLHYIWHLFIGITLMREVLLLTHHPGASRVTTVTRYTKQSEIRGDCTSSRPTSDTKRSGPIVGG